MDSTISDADFLVLMSTMLNEFAKAAEAEEFEPEAVLGERATHIAILESSALRLNRISDVVRGHGITGGFS